ncbi:MAG: hypothetical protein E7559_05440 [Ruminococcaceae bacterium]|nr:hypothetical protein [Oscillospiraceae bacterium]
MRLNYRLPTFEYMLDTVCRTAAGEGSGLPVSRGLLADTLFQYYPRLNKQELTDLPHEQLCDYIAEELGEVYGSSMRQLGDRAAEWQVYWDKNTAGVCAAFEEIFDISLERKLQRLTGNITLNPITGSDRQKQTYDLFWMNSARGACGISLHEISHMVWFMKWHEHFGDAPELYCAPDLRWVFSEMVTEAILSHPVLAPLNPYRGRTCPEYFNAVRIEGQPLLAHIDRLYRENDIVGFMEQGFRFCIDNERVIRSVVC